MLLPKSVSAAEAVRLVQSGNRVLLGSGCATPDVLIAALMERASELADVELVHLLTFGIAPYADPKYHGSFRHNAFFIGGNVRSSVQSGDADFTPIFLSEIPDLFVSRQMAIDVAMVMITPPDSRGYCSVGIHPDILMTGIDCAKRVIAQINPRMVRVHGDTFVHVSRFDAIVDHEVPLKELPTGTTDDVSHAIAGHVAALIENGSTLQLGIGKIPDAVLAALGGHRDLGVHSEMISDGVIDLIEAGVISNMKKGLHPGKTVASFSMGTQRLYDYLHDNPFFEFHRTEHVNSPRIIAQNNKMVAVNSALQVDLTGQICADSIGP
ncbi:MAG: acetyl-CoA hydrolase/transferase family protein, partial [Candidatus Eisenbacteria bacterium]|nr:acetyl-CoA hydrolase/transferase family protein [Candidatus Eisenbacteria bacterium]